MRSDKVGVVDFPTLGHLVDEWITQHCRIPDGFQRRKPFVQYDVQFWVAANHYRVREDAKFDADAPPMNQAFTYRRTEYIDAQKVGKGPWAACQLTVMAVGPSEFGGWAKAGEVYDCEDNGCGCGWYYEYEPGEPIGIRHPSPLIQVLATSEDQVSNTWRPLRATIMFGPLKHLLLPRDTFIRIAGGTDDPDMDQIQKVTSSATARLGAPISNYVQDEHGIYLPRNGMVEVADTMRRGAAGMGGRGICTSNPWDPTEQSSAQQSFDADMDDVFTYFPAHSPSLSWSDRRERRKLLEEVYAPYPHVNVDSIMAEADELIKKGESAQAERFFGCRLVQGEGAWLSADLWEGAWAGGVAS